ncbi:MAG: FecR domain-containing protein [Spirochaetales bacterium]|nr:FecR domain-containing protein [Spirochaetales bacterium]
MKIHVIAAALLAVLLACAKEKPAVETTSMVIVHTSGEARVIRQGRTENARVGLLVHEADEIQTTTGSVDLQTRGGSAVRVKENTSMTVAMLLGRGDARLSLKQGSLLATVKKSRADEEFAVVTPTAIAGVRGTTFSVSVDQAGKQPRVKVIEGKVALAPRIAVLETLEEKAIEEDASLRQLAQIQESAVILEAGQQGSLNPVVEQRVSQLNEELVAEEKNSPQEIGQAAAELSAAQTTVIAVAAPVSVAELSEKASLVTVAPEIVEQAAREDQGAAIAAAREERRTQEVARMEVDPATVVKKEAEVAQIQAEATRRQLQNQAAIRAYYQKMETVMMNDGSMHEGAVIAQTEGELVLHTPGGVIRLEKSEVHSIEYR